MATVDRVLPWRRHNPAPYDALSGVVSAYRARHPKAPLGVITRAYETAGDAHRNQYRSSGEAYINHPLAVARIVADMGLDEVSVAAALLHDAVEDSELTVKEVEAAFGKEIAAIVDGVTKLEKIHFDSKEAQQAATMRKMLVAMARDIRVLMIKLADRLHNMRTIAGMRPDKQRRIAQETLDIYAPLAHRLGMQELKQQLEDLAFAAIFAKRFAELDYLVSNRTPEREVYLARTLSEVRRRLSEMRIGAEVTGRGKHLWSIYEKMVTKGRDFDDIFDLVAIRVVVDSVKDCYAALGCIHGQWAPVVGRFKDYVAMPKFNLYQSLHTTVIGPEGKTIEVQIRTREMHHRAEWGVAAHWAYKDGTSSDDIDWLNRIIDWTQDTADPAQFMEGLKSDLELDEIFVFTPKGKVIALPRGATPIDFAYAVHTEVGHSCIGSKINGELRPLSSALRSGDTVEIFTSKVDTAAPSRDWLGFAASQRAKSKIRQWFARERRDVMLEAGREELLNALKREGLPGEIPTDLLAREAEAARYVDVESYLVAIGERHVSAQGVAQRAARELREDADEPDVTASIVRDPTRKRTGDIGVTVEGLDDVLVRLSKCCMPVPGDEILGFITRGRGVSVHRADCTNAAQLAATGSAPMVEVEWSGDHSGSVFRAAVEVAALDRSRLLRDVANAIADHHVNIVACSTHTGNDRVAKMRFEFELADPSHLDSVLRTIQRIDNVYDAYRLVPGKAG